jgi:hypothetical protein
MRTIEVDQFEFDNPSTEEHLEIAIEARARFPDVERFMSARLGAVASDGLRLGKVAGFSDALGYNLVRDYLKRFAGFTVPDSCSWPTYVLEDGPDRWEIVLCAPDSFVHYIWQTTG